MVVIRISSAREDPTTFERKAFVRVDAHVTELITERMIVM